MCMAGCRSANRASSARTSPRLSLTSPEINRWRLNSSLVYNTASSIQSLRLTLTRLLLLVRTFSSSVDRSLTFRRLFCSRRDRRTFANTRRSFLSFYYYFLLLVHERSCCCFCRSSHPRIPIVPALTSLQSRLFSARHLVSKSFCCCFFFCRPHSSSLALGSKQTKKKMNVFRNNCNNSFY